MLKIQILDATLLNQIKQSKCMASTAQMSIDGWESNRSIHCIYWDVLNYGNLSAAAYSRIVSHVHLAVGPTWLYSFCFEQMKLRNVPSVASKVTFVMLVCSYWKGSQFNLSSDLFSLWASLWFLSTKTWSSTSGPGIWDHGCQLRPKHHGNNDVANLNRLGSRGSVGHTRHNARLSHSSQSNDKGTIFICIPPAPHPLRRCASQEKEKSVETLQIPLKICRPLMRLKKC